MSQQQYYPGQVITLREQGLTNKEIQERLGINRNTCAGILYRYRHEKPRCYVVGHDFEAIAWGWSLDRLVNTARKILNNDISIMEQRFTNEEVAAMAVEVDLKEVGTRWQF